ncbi:DNA-primase RepB domain-containing protein [Pseudoduganella danionis]|nr:DNA-primase RepB domain-containing protein [Pseudoduganella danionis]
MMAMGCQRFVVTLIDAKLGKQEERDWDQDKVMQNIGWLKHMNARGYDVWIRPSGEHNLIVLGGLSAAQLQALNEREYLPAVVIETGTGQYQAWLKLSNVPVVDNLRYQVKQEVFKDFERAGIKATDRADGRLAGFTNQQVQLSGGATPICVAQVVGR